MRARYLALAILFSSVLSPSGSWGQPLPPENIPNYRELLPKISRRDPILGVSWTPGSSSVITISPDRATSWDWQTGLERWRFQASWTKNAKFASAPKASIIAVGIERTLEIRQLPSGKLIATTAGSEAEEFGMSEPEGFSALAIGADTLVAAGTTLGKICTWNWKAKEPITCSAPRQSEITAIAIDSTSQRIFSVVRNEIAVSAIGRQDVTERYLGNWGDLSALALSGDGLRFAVGSAEGNIWWGESGSVPKARKLSTRLTHISSLRFSPDGSALVSGDRDGQIQVWNVETQQVTLSLDGHIYPIRDLDFDPQGKLLASASSDGTARIWSFATGDLVRTIEGHARTIHHTALSPNGRWLLVLDTLRSVYLWDLKRGAETFRLSEDDFLTSFSAFGDVTSLAVDSHGELLAFGFNSGDIRLIRPQENEAFVSSFTASHDNSPKISALAFDFTGHHLASGAQDGSLVLWDPSAEEPLIRTLDRANIPIDALTFEPKSRLVVAMKDRSLIRWDVDSGEKIQQSRTEENIISLASFPKDGLLLTTKDGSLLIWNQNEPDPQNLLSIPGNLKHHALSLGGSYRAWVDSERIIHVETFSPSANSYSQTWSLLSGVRDTWIGCNPSGTCQRQDDGTLLVTGGDDRISPYPPPGGEANDISFLAPPNDLLVPDGQAVPISIEIENRGLEAVYWLRLRRIENAPADSLTFLPPPAYQRLEPGEKINLVGQVIVQSTFNDPKEQLIDLNLELRTGRGVQHSEPIAVHSTIPSVSVKKVTWHDASGELEIRVENLGEASLPKANFGLFEQTTPVGPLQPGSLASGEEGTFHFPLPKGTFEDGKFTLVVHSLEHPPHQWTLRVQESRPLFNFILLPVGILLGLMVLLAVAWHFYFRLYWHPLVLRITKEPEMFFHLPADQLNEITQLLDRTGRLQRILSQIGIRRNAVDDAIAILETRDPKKRYGHFVGHLGLEAKDPTGDDSQLWRLVLGEDFPLNLSECLLALPSHKKTCPEILAHLRVQPKTSERITLILTSDMEVQNELSRQTGPENPWVAPTSSEVTQLLLEPNPVETLAEIIGGHVEATKISPYQLAGGIKKATMFFGRTSQLAQIQHGDHSNYLVVGARQVGKSSLLHALKRTLENDPKIACHYLVLSDHALIERLAEKFEIENDEPTAVDLRRYLESTHQRHLVLIDEVDPFIRHDQTHQYSGLQLLRSLSEEGKCQFILAGFWDLFAATHKDYHSPLKNFGTTIRVGELECDACYKLITEPMARMQIRFEDNALVQHLIEQTGQRANLISIACDEIVNGLNPGSRVITASDLETALHSIAIHDALKIGALDEKFGRLESIINYATIADDEFSFADLVECLSSLGVQANEEDIDRALRRLQLACVLRELGPARYTYQVPLYRQMVIEREPKRLLKEALKD